MSDQMTERAREEAHREAVENESELRALARRMSGDEDN